MDEAARASASSGAKGEDTKTSAMREASSPYATGGGGVTFERRVGALYLSLLLTGGAAPELGDGRAIASVAFQQAPRIPIDDLVIRAARENDAEPSLELAVAIRRRPSIVRSNEDTAKLVVEYVRALLNMPDDDVEHRLALVVSGQQAHAVQLAELAALARNQMDAASFFALFADEGRFARQLVTRLEHFRTLVKNALESLGVDGDTENAQLRTWELLSRLHVLMPAVEEPNTSEWSDAQSRLATVARGGDLVAAGNLLNRLETLAGQYGPSAATIDRKLLLRDVDPLIERGRSRHSRGWQLLGHLQRQARAAVRTRLGEGSADTPLHLDRSTEEREIMAAASGSPALVVDGESGVGKSALVLSAAISTAESDPDNTQVICVNLRHFPERSFDLVAQLECPIETLLSEMSAPKRYLVVDGADAATESLRDLFAYLVDAARASGLQLIAITSAEGRQVVRDVIADRLNGEQVADYTVSALSDEQVGELAATFPQLARLAANARSRELLRRLVVVDLLVRSEVSGLPLSDVDAMSQVWSGLVRNHGQRDRGVPDTREQVLMRLASRELLQESASELAPQLDAAAIDGLRQDGLLRTSTENPWQSLPDFAHDEVRRYAVARVLLADGDPTSALVACGAPRWALTAARLACQAVLAQPANAAAPMRGRLGRLQSAFDGLITAGHGSRWADVPSEAALTLGDPVPLLTDAWSELRQDDDAGLMRLLRLVNQRHRDESGIVDLVVVEPIIGLVLKDVTPWRDSDETEKVLRQWLLALVVRDTPAGHPLRIRLRERLVACCAQAEERLAAELEAAEAARAARTPQQVAEEEKLKKRGPMFSELGFGGRRRRRRPAVPRELTDDTVLELLALLGLDLDASGEQLLRRVARDAPMHLGPAIEEVGTGRALASYGHGLLADLAEAYYVDEDDDGSGFHNDGVRDHQWRGPVAPLAAWYRGPFGALFQTDFRRGVAVLNRLLNHAARARIRTLASIGDPWNRMTDDEIDAASVELRVTGAEQRYVGDEHVWYWYRGTGVGPYLCMSALEALERVCDQILSVDVPVDRLVEILMEGCENLAMPALVVGLLVRHLERAGTSLDPFLAEPLVWQLEFSRVVHESGGLAASSEGLVEPERRSWSCREAASWLTLNADPERASALAALGNQLVERAREIEEGPSSETADANEPERPTGDVPFSTTVKGWASALDRSRYRAYAEGDQMYVRSDPPEEVEAALRGGNEDLQRGQEVLRIHWRYFAGGARGREKTPPPIGDELAADLSAAQELLNDPPKASAVGVWKMAAAVAAHALEVLVLHDETLPDEAKGFAVTTVLAVAERTGPASQFEDYGTFFEQAADRSAARALPLLLLPAAVPLRKLPGEASDVGLSRVVEAGHRLAHAVANETRLHLARGLDPIWDAPCSEGGRCHHEVAFELAIESMRDCVLGPWDNEAQQRPIETLEDPTADSLEKVAGGDIFLPRLDAAIRALGAAVARQTCVHEQARELLAQLLAAQRRALLAYDRDFDHRGTHTLVAARALLSLSTTGDDAALYEQIATYADNSARLASLLRALAAAAEETVAASEAARRVWPDVIAQVLELNAEGHATFADRHYGGRALAALMPTPAHEIEFLYHEVGAVPINWTDPLAWETVIDDWVSIAAGDRECVDSMISLLLTLPEQDQVAFGLPRVAALVQGDIDAVARRSFLVAQWLKDIRAAAVDGGAQSAWQQLVDALVVAGDTSLAPYSE